MDNRDIDGNRGAFGFDVFVGNPGDPGLKPIHLFCE